MWWMRMWWMQMNHLNRLRASRDSARSCKFYIPEKFLALINL